MFKRSSRFNGTMRLMLALMMAVPQGLNVYAEETADPEATAAEPETEIVAEIPETEELIDEVLTQDEEETAVEEVTEETEEVPEVTEIPDETVSEEPSEEVDEEETGEPEQEPAETEEPTETEEPAEGTETEPEQEPAEVSVTLSASDVELKVGDTFAFEAVVTGTEEETAVVWSTDDDTVIALDENGNVTALKEGIANVRASVLDGTATADAVVKVVSAEDAQIVFEERSYELEIGDTVIVSYELADGKFEDIEWTIDAEDIISIDTSKEGEVAVTALESGVVQVTGEIEGSSSTFAVVVLAEPDVEYESIRAMDDVKAAAVTGTYSVTYNQSSARDLAQQLNYYRWNTAKINTLTYDYTIEKYAMKRAAEIVMNYSHTRPNGNAWHTIFDKTVYGNQSTTNLNENLLYSGGGTMSTAAQVLNLVLANNKQRTCSLYSSNKSFGIGHVIYNGVDYWVMMFSDYPANNTSQTAAVNWDQDVSVGIKSGLFHSPSFSASKSLVKLKVNKSADLPSISCRINVSLGGQTRTIACTKGYSTSWSLDTAGKKYASISGSTVKAKGEPNNNETAYLIATNSLDGSSYKVKVELKVIQPVTGVSVSPTEASVDLGKTVKLTATVKPDNATDKTVTWKSSNTKIATVSSKGVVTAKKGGTCTITVTTNDGGFKASSKITVIVHPKAVSFEISELTMTVGMSEKLVPVFIPADTTDKAVTWTSSNSAKVKIASDGTVSALAVTGDDPVIITVKTHDGGLTADLPVTVKEKDQVKKPTASYLYESYYEFPAYEYDGDEYPNTLVKGDGIILHSDTKDAVIYYTTDGSTPTTSSTKYTGMFPFPGGSFMLKVIAVKPTQMTESEVAVFKLEETDEHTWEIWPDDLEKWKGDDGKYHLPAGLWAAGIDEKVQFTGGKITFPDIRVYYRNKELAVGTDYKITYKNNVNVCPEDSPACTVTLQDDGSYKPAKKTKISYVTITGKGNYKGSTYAPFQIEPIAISAENNFKYQSELYLSIGTKALRPVPVILWDGRKLKNKTDFVVAYSKDAAGTQVLEDGITEPGDYYAIITGVKNYTSDPATRLAVPIHVTSEAQLLSKASIKIANVEYTGETIDSETLDITVKMGKTLLEKGKDYVIESTAPADPKDIGTVSLTIKAAEGSQYLGEKTGSFKITGRSISKAKVYCLGTSVTYKGTTFELKELYKTNPSRPGLSKVTLYYGDEELTEDVDYVVDVNGEKKGSGSVKFKGIGKYTGTLTKKFTITAKQITKKDLEIYVGYITFTKTGAKPYVEVYLKTEPYIDEMTGEKLDKIWLAENKDYTLKYFNNKKIYTDEYFKTKNPPSVSIILKGNYKGTIANNNFLIMEEEISYMTMKAADSVYSASKKGTKNYVKPVIYDYEGKKLKLNKDYVLTYYYAQDAKVNGSSTYNRAYGTAIRATDVPSPGTVIAVEATGIGSYYGTLKTEYKVILKTTNLSSAKVAIDYQNGKNKYFEYSGAQIVPGKDNLTVKIGTRTLTYGVDYEIQSVTNNIRAGKATLILHGIGEFGGTKKVTFNIGKQSLILDIGNLIRSVLGLEY
ncbi:MAG: Ig-like domain-containing protein [Solobacterium sp.]|nr:Ig-like domain-containing protein [Solobacterium sp.]